VFRVLLPVSFAALLIAGCGGGGDFTTTGTDQGNSGPVDDSGTTTAPSSEEQAQEPLVEYSIQGGIAGYDSLLTVYPTGRVTYQDRGNTPVRFRISDPSLHKLRLELERAKNAESDPPPPAGPDSIATHLTYRGEEITAVSAATGEHSELQRIYLSAFTKAARSKQ
jgi:hypothetical protein